MALINLNANFSMLVSVLDRIANALERAVGPVVDLATPTKKRGPEAIIKYGDGDREWAKQQFRGIIHERGHAPAREADLLKVAMKRWDWERKNPGQQQEE